MVGVLSLSSEPDLYARRHRSPKVSSLGSSGYSDFSVRSMYSFISLTLSWADILLYAWLSKTVADNPASSNKLYRTPASQLWDALRNFCINDSLEWIDTVYSNLVQYWRRFGSRMCQSAEWALKWRIWLSYTQPTRPSKQKKSSKLNQETDPRMVSYLWFCDILIQVVVNL